MRIAFYAPLKPPDHPTPSGDREVARLFLAALRMAGHEAFVASRLRSYEGRGDAGRQARLARLGGMLAQRFLRRCRAGREPVPDAWFSYHLYHKAPDWLGPAIAGELGIPYVIAEASDAPKQAVGKWAAGRDATLAAIRRADAVIGLNSADRECVLPLLPDPGRWVAVKPFLDARCFERREPARKEPPHLVTIAMMRYGDKLASYRMLGAALAELLDLHWSLEVIGDGAARREVEEALDPVKGRVMWSGTLGSTAVRHRLAVADLFVWPAVNEAFGMAVLEAQASGLPVVAGASGGLGEIVVQEVTGLLVPPGDMPGFAAAVRKLIVDGRSRAAFSEAAREHIRQEHDLSAAAPRLAAVMDRVWRARRG